MEDNTVPLPTFQIDTRFWSQSVSECGVWTTGTAAGSLLHSRQLFSAATSDRTVVECSSLLLGVGTTLKKLFCCLCKMFMRRSDVAVDVDQYKYHMRYASIVLPNVDCLYVGVGRDNRQV